MDALIVFIIGLILAKGYERQKEVVQTNAAPPIKLKKRMNPNFVKHEDAFMSLYNAIMKGGK